MELPSKAPAGVSCVTVATRPTTKVARLALHCTTSRSSCKGDTSYVLKVWPSSGMHSCYVWCIQQRCQHRGPGTRIARTSMLQAIPQGLRIWHLRTSSFASSLPRCAPRAWSCTITKASYAALLSRLRASRHSACTSALHIVLTRQQLHSSATQQAIYRELTPWTGAAVLDPEHSRSMAAQ